MAVRLGDTAPDFTAQTTEGEINFHEWLGDSWGVLFSHPKDFTPVCTTELGLVAKLKPEFDKRNVKVIGLSVDSIENHGKWADDIKETQGTAVNFPVIGDADKKVSDLYDMIHPNANDTLTVRSVSATSGKFSLAPCVSSMSAAQPPWFSSPSTDRPITLTLRLSNSGFSLATAPSSVVQTGV